jgi:hypothetical protein
VAHELVRCYQNCIVGIQQLDYDRPVQPIVQRAAIKNFYYNYFPDNTYRRTLKEKDGKEVASYALYLPIPDTVRYHDLLLFCRENMRPFAGRFRSFVHYKTANEKSFVFSVEHGKVTIDLDVPFDGNPIFTYFFGSVRENKYDPDKYRRIRARQEAGIIGKSGRPRKGTTDKIEETITARAIVRKNGRPRLNPNAPPSTAATNMISIEVIDEPDD